MRVFVDTNVLIDVLAAREGFLDDSLAIWELCETSVIEGYISTFSILDVVYILRKDFDEDSISSTIAKLQQIFSFVALEERDVVRASNLHWKDFEDGVQSCLATKIHADYLVTRNTSDYGPDTGFEVISPSDFLEMVQKSTQLGDS